MGLYRVGHDWSDLAAAASFYAQACVNLNTFSLWSVERSGYRTSSDRRFIFIMLKGFLCCLTLEKLCLSAVEYLSTSVRNFGKHICLHQQRQQQSSALSPSSIISLSAFSAPYYTELLFKNFQICPVIWADSSQFNFDDPYLIMVVAKVKAE